jgi:hypothetical protein
LGHNSAKPRRGQNAGLCLPGATARLSAVSGALPYVLALTTQSSGDQRRIALIQIVRLARVQKRGFRSDRPTSLHYLPVQASVATSGDGLNCSQFHHRAARFVRHLSGSLFLATQEEST